MLSMEMTMVSPSNFCWGLGVLVTLTATLDGEDDDDDDMEEEDVIYQPEYDGMSGYSCLATSCFIAHYPR